MLTGVLASFRSAFLRWCLPVSSLRIVLSLAPAGKIGKIGSACHLISGTLLVKVPFLLLLLTSIAPSNPLQQTTKMSYLGIDGCKSGWVCCSIRSGSLRSIAVYRTISELWSSENKVGKVKAAMIDMPIGETHARSNANLSPSNPFIKKKYIYIYLYIYVCMYKLRPLQG